MVKTSKNICYRCGKDRTIVRVWKEKIENSVIENTEYACTDKECREKQKQELQDQKNKRIEIENRRKKMFKNRKLKIKKTVRG